LFSIKRTIEKIALKLRGRDSDEGGVLPRIASLRQIDINAIDTLPEHNLPVNKAIAKFISDKSETLLSFLDENYRQEIQDFLLKNEDMSDSDLVQSLSKHYAINDFQSSGYANPNIIISKMNHGFWEHLAFLHAREQHRHTYRDVNLAFRERQYLTGGFLDMLMGSMLAASHSPGIYRFISATTGVESFSKCLGTYWDEAAPSPSVPYKLPEFKRGAVRGLLVFSHLFNKRRGSDEPLVFFDSYSNNLSFEEGALLSNLKSTANSDTVCLIVGPAHLNKVRVIDWPGSHSFLCLSSTLAHAHWRINIENILSVLKHYDSQSKNVVILFQGGALGPVVAWFVNAYKAHLSIDVAFLDLGRLLDIAFEADLTRTGSPLPSRTFKMNGAFHLSNANDRIFEEDAA
jgi:hypothetical protein